ncbi:hypothetical protein [Deinococcus arcticus]|uniref:Aminoglycoside phosphotransferase domain-containing protein n=1 Tax=Deinococcus arcticus TaxID=2136176 RepID=A0A2T3WBT2_9DEIO|nr:hypothetical protein [Deinococcus arcticus]PTA69365.1 hypothetical protein C8263_03315 [Deinococcus arcticus]
MVAAGTVTELNAGDSSRASHVWLAETATGPEIWRRAWWTVPEVSAFMLGLGQLFGTDPRDLQATAQAYRFWQSLNVWAVPEVYGLTEFRGGPALRVEFLPGDTGDLAAADAHTLGRQVAAVHEQGQAQRFGDVTGRVRWPVAEFYPRALATVRAVAPRFRFQAWAAHEAEVSRVFGAAPAPTQAVPMLLDWHGSQFVWRGGQPDSLVDVEASVLAPPELDLCLWEVLLFPPQAPAFLAGYREVRPFPDLSAHRAACRILLLALEVEGAPPLREWLARPAPFAPQP